MEYFWKVSSKAKEMLSHKDEAGSNAPQESKEENTATNLPSALGNEKPASSLSLETQQGNSDREVSSESEGVNSEKNSESGESHRTLEGDAERGIKVGISAGDLKDASHKAVESAKTFGSFLYGVANKTGRSISETAKHIKTTVEENSILGDFNKEQEAFATSKGDTKEESPAPWADAENMEDVKQQILSLSADRRNFLRSPPTGVMFDFNFDDMYPIAKTMLKEDPELEKMRFEIVPKLVNEETFWKNYFYRVSLVKQSSKLSKMANKKSDSLDSSSTSTGGKSPSDESLKGMEKTVAEGNADSDATDSPNHEFASDAFQSNKVSEDDIKRGMQMLGVGEPQKDEDWEREMQQELQDYEVVAGENDDPDWENEIERMLEDKVKDVV